MHSFIPVSLVATATFFSAAQGINILQPAAGDIVDAAEGFDIVWTYNSTDFTNWEIELANTTPSKVIATSVTEASVTGSATSTASYHVPSLTGIVDGGNYRVVLDPQNGGADASPESGEFTIVNVGAVSTSSTLSSAQVTTISSRSSSSPVTASSSSAVSTASGTQSSASVIPTISVPKNSTIVTSSTQFSTFTSGSITSKIPQSTVIETTVVMATPTSTTGTSSTGSPAASHTALAAAGSAISPVGLLSGIVAAILGVFLL